MIKINLIAEGKRPSAPGPKRVGGLAEGVDPSLWWLVGLLLVGILVAAGHYFLVGRKLDSVQAEVDAAQQEVDELAPIIAEVQEFKAKKAELERKVQVISELKANQKGPVQIMDRVSGALPPLLWLSRMEVKAKSITIAGEAFNPNAVANFIENLDRVPEFQEPNLRNIQRQREVYSFVVTFNYSYAPARPDSAPAEAVSGG